MGWKIVGSRLGEYQGRRETSKIVGKRIVGGSKVIQTRKGDDADLSENALICRAARRFLPISINNN